MPEPTALFDAEFAAFRAAVLPHIAPAGPDAVRGTVRRRRRITAAAAVTALALVVGPVGAYAAMDHRSGPPPVALGASTSASPSPRVVPPTDAPTGDTPSATPSGTPAAPDGRISRNGLLRFRLELASWPTAAPASCLAHHARLTGSKTQALDELQDQMYADIDADGAEETVILVGCRPGEVAYQQVVALDRDADGNIVKRGLVVRSETLDPAPGKIAWITGMAENGPGSIRVQVADIQPCCSTPKYLARRQWRTYSWTGHGFQQTAGPTTWGPDDRLADLRIDSGSARFDPPGVDDGRHAALSVTVSNTGPSDAQYISLVFPPELKIDTRGVCQETDAGGEIVLCMVPGPDAGQQRTYVIGLRWDSSSGPVPSTVDLRVERYDQQKRPWPDRRPDDNQKSVPVELT